MISDAYFRSPLIFHSVLLLWAYCTFGCPPSLTPPNVSDEAIYLDRVDRPTADAWIIEGRGRPTLTGLQGELTACESPLEKIMTSYQDLFESSWGLSDVFRNVLLATKEEG
jgi:hypothetical protein